MHPYLKEYRHKFISDGVTYTLENAPIGYDEIEQEIKRGKKTDSLMLNVSQNLKFVGKDAVKLREYLSQKGVGHKPQFIREKKEFDNFEVENQGYFDLSTLVSDKNTATADFTETVFDEVLENNIKEDFELDRDTDINGNPITSLVRSRMSYKSREIFLRSELELTENVDQTDTFGVGDAIFTPKLTATVRSDEDVQGVYDLGYRPPDENISVANFFHYNSFREKKLKFKISAEYTDVSQFDSAQYRIYRYTIVEGNHTLAQTYNLGSSFTNQSTVAITDEEVEIEMGENEGLVFGLYIDFQVVCTATASSCHILQTEDSFFEPNIPSERYVDAISLKYAFERVVEILDPNVRFESTFLDSEFPSVVITAGESLRHIYYNDKKAPIATTSFQDLFDFVFCSLGPVGYGIRTEGTQTILELERIEHFFDDEVAIDLGTLSDITTKINKDRVYSRIEIGYNKSGKNEDVFGLQATHTVNTFVFNPDIKENTYLATCDIRTDPNEAELCYRKQFSQFPDEDTRYDKDIFAFDCYSKKGLFVPYEWTEHFSAVEGIYSPDTAYNYRFTPMNCLLRHGANFKQEYYKPCYSNKSVIYTSSNGNTELITTVTGGTARQESSNVLYTDLPNPIYTEILIEGETDTSYPLKKTINGGVGKKNYYKTVCFRDELGNKNYGFIDTSKITDKIKADLYLKYGF